MRGLLRREMYLTTFTDKPRWFYIFWTVILIFEFLCMSEKSASKLFGENLIYFEAIADMTTSLFFTLGFSWGFVYYQGNKHEQYYLTLPYSKTQIVTARYIEALIITLFFSSFWVGLGRISESGMMVYESLIYSIPMLISMPLYYVFGNKLCIFISVTVTVFSNLILNICAVVFEAQIESAFIFTRGFPILYAVIIVAYFLSWSISVHFYKRSDI